MWSWGAGTHGQLACGTLIDALTPQRVEALSDAALIVDIACGGAHGIAVFECGDVATWGRGQAGALGHGDETTITVPRFISSLQGIRISHAAAGWNHSAFVTDNGALYTCGDGTFGQLGHGHTESRLVPGRVEHLSSERINMVACGMRHTLALAVTQGSVCTSIVYAFGFNKRGQLGIQMKTNGSESKNKWCFSCPQRVDSLDMHGVVSVSANGDHSAALTRMGDLFLWGRGYNDGPDSQQPHLSHSGLKLIQVSLGWRHGLALAENKVVFAWGNNVCGQLGISRVSNNSERRAQEVNVAHKSIEQYTREREGKDGAAEKSQRQISGVDFQKVETQGMRVSWISAGSEHSAAVLEDGRIMMWGWAEHGQLGLGSLEDQEVPHMVTLASTRLSSGFFSATHDQHASANYVKTKVYCGSGYTFVVS